MSTILGTPTEEFNRLKLRRLLHEAETREQLNSAKSYLLEYFACGSPGVFKWNPYIKKFEHYSKKDACDTYIQYDKNEDSFNIQKWFFKETPVFTIDVDPTKPLTYKKPTGAYTINNFPGFLHPNPPPF